ncbi:MAG: energy transducer TonB [Fluviicola sp.]|nr:energy transducer TonB [Fluviicola sp.]
MKSIILLLTTLLLTATSWSQETQEPALAMPDPMLETDPDAPDSNYVFPLVDVAAEFPGGREGLFNYLATTIQYPERAKKLKIGGRCYLQFVVETDGTVTNAKIMRGVPDCPECDAEALRVIGLMPKWKPGEVEGKPVRSNFNLPVTFKPN